jgi:hypothetical protein
VDPRADALLEGRDARRGAGHADQGDRLLRVAEPEEDVEREVLVTQVGGHGPGLPVAEALGVAEHAGVGPQIGREPRPVREVEQGGLVELRRGGGGRRRRVGLAGPRGSGLLDRDEKGDGLGLVGLDRHDDGRGLVGIVCRRGPADETGLGNRKPVRAALLDERGLRLACHGQLVDELHADGRLPGQGFGRPDLERRVLGLHGRGRPRLPVLLRVSRQGGGEKEE